MRRCLQKRTMIVLVVICALVASCTRGDFELSPDNNSDAELVADSTYCNVILSLSSNDGTSTRTAGDDGSTAEERKVTNLTLMFFNADNLKLEASANFTELDSVGEDKYKLKKAMQVTAGRKKVVALVNVPSSLKARLATIKSYGDCKNFLLNTHGGTDYLKELGVTNPRHEAPHQSHVSMAAANGLLMTGECNASLIAGVTESDVIVGKNNISDFYVDRAVVKVKVVVEKAFYTKLKEAYPGIFQTHDVTSPTIQIRNLPNHSFLLARDEYMSPYYNSLDFTNWDFQTSYLYLGTTSDNEVKTGIAYIPENTFSTAYRGNTSYIHIAFRVGYKTNNPYVFYAFYDQTKNETFFQQGQHIRQPKYDIEEVKKFFNGHKGKYMEGEDLKGAYVISHAGATKDKTEQDNLVRNNLTAGYYLFIYRAETPTPSGQSEVWYDEIQLYKYTGVGLERYNRQDFKSAYYASSIIFRINLTDLLVNESSNKRYSINRNTAFTINIKGIKTPTGTGFEVPGYPHLYDTYRRPGDKLTESGMGLDITVEKWGMGGGTNVDIED